MKTGYYLRASSKSQDTRSQEPEMSAHSGKQANVVFYRDKFTGKGMIRPGWLKLWADVCAGKIGKIVVWRLDRLGRTVAGLSQLLSSYKSGKSAWSPCATGSTSTLRQEGSWLTFWRPWRLMSWR
jgi:DNA invertase Pin-like site-specific DNA recombinase